MNLYIAGKVREASNEDLLVFYDAQGKLRLAGHVVFNPVEFEREAVVYDLTEQDKQRTLMRQFTNWICRNAEGLALLPNWLESRGAKAEASLAHALDIPIRNWSEWL